MLLFLGVLTFFATTLSLLASFVQYMSLATSFVERESELRRDRILAELRTQAATAPRPLVERDVLHRRLVTDPPFPAAPRAGAIHHGHPKVAGRVLDRLRGRRPGAGSVADRSAGSSPACRG